MTLVFRTILLSILLLVVGILAVALEAERIRVGYRIHNLLDRREEINERVRRLEIRYNRMVSLDRLNCELPDSFQPDSHLVASGEEN